MHRYYVLLFAHLLSLCAATDEPGWRTRQKSHVPVSLASDVLDKVALLDRHSDPAEEAWSRLLRPLLVPRYVTSAAHEDVRKHLVDVLTRLGWTVDGDRTFKMRTPVGEMPFTNVVATHDPAAPRRLVLACHYDSIYGRDSFVAATDSAVPCAMMLYLAHLMTSRYLDPIKGRSDTTLQLMFLDGEEAIVEWTDDDSIYGARHLAGELQQTAYQGTGGGSNATLTELDRIDLFVLLDLLGAKEPAIANYFSNTNAEFRHLVLLERKLRKKGLLPEVPKIFRYIKSWGFRGPPQVADDHLPFLRKGVRVLHLIPVPFPAAWHRDDDDASAVHAPTVTALGRILRTFVAEWLGLAAFETVSLGSEIKHEEL